MLDIYAYKFDYLIMLTTKKHSVHKNQAASRNAEDPWATMFETTKLFSADFMSNRDQGTQSSRKCIEEPKEKGRYA